MKTNKHVTRAILIHSLGALLLLGSSMLVEAVTNFTTLHKFVGVEGDIPHGFLAQNRDGSLFGSTEGQSINPTVFKITPAGVFSVLHTFNAAPAKSTSPLILGLDGNFYGTSGNGNLLGGTIFKMTPAGVITVLHTFGSVLNDGFNMGGHFANFGTGLIPPVQAPDGTLYGTTNSGGKNNSGIVYKLTPSGTYTILRHFTFSVTDGALPLAPLIIGKDGNLYGTTRVGGKPSASSGTVFRITPTGAFKILHSFDATITDGGHQPNAPLVQGTDGNFYGTTKGSGVTVTQGNVFKITPSGVYTNLHRFDSATAFAQGTLPTAGLVQGSDGNFYGATSAGGKAIPFGNYGVLFKITPQGAYTVLHTFNQPIDSSDPWQSLVQHTNGKLYGTTAIGLGGSVFSLDVGAKPFVLAQPSTGKVGGTVGLLGDFTGVTSVTFNGVNASISGTGTTFRVATIPAGPATGLIKINKPTGAISSLKPFLVQPTLTSFSPVSGAVGRAVILTGRSLSQVTSIRFGGNKVVPKSLISMDNDNQLTVNVPIGAVSGKLTVTTSGGSATSATNFTVTP
ncbi:MAG: choice-of-anchor tandem repeat GloVer-containing protein [Methyloglobulus sp.]|nr:hypothetical protein [Methyloglobulus sp.]